MFCQVVIGPPGCGKTTYCNGMQQFMEALGRKVAVVNLDPANELLPYKAAIDIVQLVRMDVVMECKGLGPNGGLMYCMEYLERNLEWLTAQLRTLQEQGFYVLFDCPGQVELYTHHNSMKNILESLQRMNYRIAAVHLVDSLHCANPASYISILLLSLTTMLQLELPHVNVLSKFDLVREDDLAFNIEFYTEVQDLKYLRRALDISMPRQFKRMNKALSEVVEDFGLVSFCTLDIQNKESVAHLLSIIDKANGYVFGGLTRGNESIMGVADQC